MTPLDCRFIWMDGALVASAEATVPFLTAGLHYGIGVFEGIRSYQTAHGPAIFRLPEHMARLMGSARILGWADVPYSQASLTAAVVETVRANDMGDAYIRPLIYLGSGGWNLTLETGRPHVGIAAWQWPALLGEAATAKGVRAKVSSFTRLHPNANMTKAKIAGHYVNSVLAKEEAGRFGLDEAVMLDSDGYVAECTGANIFIVRSGRLLTPSTESILEGVTRATVMQMAADDGITVHETRLSRDQLYLADEVFLSGTAAEIVAIVELDGRRIGTGLAGPVTRRLQRRYDDAVRGHGPRKEWLTFVNGAPWPLTDLQSTAAL